VSVHRCSRQARMRCSWNGPSPISDWSLDATSGDPHPAARGGGGLVQFQLFLGNNTDLGRSFVRRCGSGVRRGV
jgi:hypothetical protein